MENITETLPALVALYQSGAAWYVVAALALWAVLQVVLNKDGFRVPFLSDYLAGIDKPTRGILVAALGAAVGMLTAVSTGDPMLIIESTLTGLSVALAAAGFHNVAAKPLLDKLSKDDETSDL